MNETKIENPPINAAVESSVTSDENLERNNTSKRRKPYFGLTLLFALVSLFVFWLIRLAYTATLGWEFVPVLWGALGLGLSCLLAGTFFGLRFLFIGWRNKKSYLFKGAAIFGTLVLSINYLMKVIMIIFFSTAQVGAAAGAMALYSPQGRVIAGLVMGLDKYVKDQMASSKKPEWRMIKIEYIGSNLPDAPGKASFLLTNAGSHRITSFEGKFHAWTLFHVEKPVAFESDVPLQPNRSIRLDYPLDGFGGQVKDIIDGKNKDIPTTVDNVLYQMDKMVDDEEVARIFKSSGPPKLNKNPIPEIDYHLRFQLEKMVDADGAHYVVWFGNLEKGKKNLLFEMMRDFTSPEWKMIKVEYLDEGNTANSNAASFRLTNTGKLTISSIEGKFHVMDIYKGHVEKTVNLKPGKPLGPGESMTFTLSPGSESKLARQIISSERKYDREAGNKEQTSYLTRFQLQELYTSDGRKVGIWFGELTGDIKPEEK